MRHYRPIKIDLSSSFHLPWLELGKRLFLSRIRYNKMQRRSVIRGDPRYKQLRARNNDSVKKSRDKNRREYENTMQSINQLEEENQQLIQNVQVIKQEYEQLQDLFKQHTGVDINQMMTTVSKSKLISPSVSTREEPKENSSTPVITINTTEEKSPSNPEFDADNLDGSVVLINGVQYKIVSMNKT